MKATFYLRVALLGGALVLGWMAGDWLRVQWVKCLEWWLGR